MLTIETPVVFRRADTMKKWWIRAAGEFALFGVIVSVVYALFYVDSGARILTFALGVLLGLAFLLYGHKKLYDANKILMRESIPILATEHAEWFIEKFIPKIKAEFGSELTFIEAADLVLAGSTVVVTEGDDDTFRTFESTLYKDEPHISITMTERLYETNQGIAALTTERAIEG